MPKMIAYQKNGKPQLPNIIVYYPTKVHNILAFQRTSIAEIMKSGYA